MRYLPLLFLVGCQGTVERLGVLETRAENLEQSLVTLKAQIGVGNVGRDKIQTEGWAAYIAIITLGIAVLSPFAIFFYMVSHRFASLRKLIDWVKGHVNT